MLLGFQTKLKLNNQQKTSMAQHAGFARWVFNWGLRAWQETYKEGLKPTAHKLKKFYTNYVKPNYPWQHTLSSRVYQYAFIDLDKAFKSFFSVNRFRAGNPRTSESEVRGDALTSSPFGYALRGEGKHGPDLGSKSRFR
jgi:putative transposase